MMYKYILIIGLLFSGCSSLKVNAVICEKIASEHGEMPQECKKYSEEEAQKAFDKTKTSNSEKEDLKFDKQ
ncbi:MAG: hypothetical protein L3I99_04240 [Sulfurimonas sp.]|nr:hypothetical protein [Sulfurimonas sp.]